MSIYKKTQETNTDSLSISEKKKYILLFSISLIIAGSIFYPFYSRNYPKFQVERLFLLVIMPILLYFPIKLFTPKLSGKEIISTIAKLIWVLSLILITLFLSVFLQGHFCLNYDIDSVYIRNKIAEYGPEFINDCIIFEEIKSPIFVSILNLYAFCVLFLLSLFGIFLTLFKSNDTKKSIDRLNSKIFMNLMKGFAIFFIVLALFKLDIKIAFISIPFLLSISSYKGFTFSPKQAFFWTSFIVFLIPTIIHLCFKINLFNPQ